jgi:hypothetical protein
MGGEKGVIWGRFRDGLGTVFSTSNFPNEGRRRRYEHGGRATFFFGPTPAQRGANDKARDRAPAGFRVIQVSSGKEKLALPDARVINVADILDIIALRFSEARVARGS